MQFITFVAALASLAASAQAAPAGGIMGKIDQTINDAIAKCVLPTKPFSLLQPVPQTLPGTSGKALHVLIGQGYQVYKCDDNDLSKAPAPAKYGAIADLYDACLIMKVGGISAVNGIPKKLMSDPQGKFIEKILSFAKEKLKVGTHQYEDTTTPGVGPASYPSWRFKGVTWHGQKNVALPAPNAADISYVYLDKSVGYTDNTLAALHAYRVDTAGGIAPPNCLNQQKGAEVRVPYAAQYVFYSG